MTFPGKADFKLFAYMLLSLTTKSLFHRYAPRLKLIYKLTFVRLKCYDFCMMHVGYIIKNLDYLPVPYNSMCVLIISFFLLLFPNDFFLGEVVSTSLDYCILNLCRDNVQFHSSAHFSSRIWFWLIYSVRPVMYKNLIL